MLKPVRGENSLLEAVNNRKFWVLVDRASRTCDIKTVLLQLSPYFLKSSMSFVCAYSLSESLCFRYGFSRNGIDENEIENEPDRKVTPVSGFVNWHKQRGIGKEFVVEPINGYLSQYFRFGVCHHDFWPVRREVCRR